MQQHVGILGYPLSHSISPAFQQAAFDYYGLSVTYHVWPAAPGDLGDAIKNLYTKNHLGANVTVPHKEAAVRLVDYVEPTAQRIGAVNTIVHHGDRLIGHNTDLEGFVRGLRKDGGFDPKDSRVLLLGAGGAARAAAFGLARERVASLTIANRTVSRAQKLVNELGEFALEVEAIGLVEPAVGKAAAECDLIVNSTAIGMNKGDCDSQNALDGVLIPPDTLVYDLVYNPVETPLIREARRMGARVLGGLPMLVYQGAAAFELWTGKDAPVDIMFSTAEQAMMGD